MKVAAGDAEEAFGGEVARCHVSCGRDHWDCTMRGVGGLQRGCTYCGSSLDAAAEVRMARRHHDDEDNAGGEGWGCARWRYWDGHYDDNHLPMASCVLVRWVWPTMKGRYLARGVEY